MADFNLLPPGWHLKEAVPSGITGGYHGDPTLKPIIVFFLGLSMYNAVELVVLVFLTFTRYSGVYFYSLLVASIGIVPYCIGLILKFFQITTDSYAYVTLITIGWWCMVTGQSVVLWSRLHLILRGARGEWVLKWIKWMIIIDAVILHIPTTVLTYGSNAALPMFVRGYNVMEKIQMSVFFVQETLISSIYMYEAVRLLQTSLKPTARNLLYQLFAINFIVILMDLGLVGLECASLYVLQVILKPTIYSIKLKLEFTVLSRLVQFVAGGSQSRRGSTVPFVTEKRKGSRRDDSEILDFVDVERSASDVTHAVPFPTARTTPMGHISASDTDLVASRITPGSGVGVPFQDIDLGDSSDKEGSVS
jgi:hypothetical protein